MMLSPRLLAAIASLISTRGKEQPGLGPWRTQQEHTGMLKAAQIAFHKEGVSTGRLRCYGAGSPPPAGHRHLSPGRVRACAAERVGARGDLVQLHRDVLCLDIP